MTPLDSLAHALENITWGQVWSAVGASFLFCVGAAWRLSKNAGSLKETQNYVEKMATNDFPHMFHTLVNIDKNIAKSTGGDPVSFTELDAQLKSGKDSK
jgi:hypothetical protein